jgi:hypothetical protein
MRCGLLALRLNCSHQSVLACMPVLLLDGCTFSTHLMPECMIHRFGVCDTDSLLENEVNSYARLDGREVSFYRVSKL